MAFAHLKRILRMGRLRLRGPTGAQDEFTLAAIAQNLRKMARLMKVPQAAQTETDRKIEQKAKKSGSDQSSKPALLNSSLLQHDLLGSRPCGALGGKPVQTMDDLGDETLVGLVHGPDTT
jgi:hypothetical protein